MMAEPPRLVAPVTRIIGYSFWDVCCSDDSAAPKGARRRSERFLPGRRILWLRWLVSSAGLMTEDPELSDLHAAHRQFSAMLADVRPALHRYCARMTGSVIDGEDLVQDTLAHAYYELSQLRA